MEESNVKELEIFEGENGEFYWRGKAGNGEIVASSAPEGYTRKHDAKVAAEATFPWLEAKEE